ncbi:hypothetical protein V6N11_055746 [Hibiscus sabdariffa]|uniref:RNase H type-1 domain-containing protein n=2 Tax=Hibiscus sabdariffa TaxID=183260 RepID=A0ABR2ACL4_9ROSI
MLSRHAILEEMQRRSWVVRLQHVLREGNGVVDLLLKTAVRDDFEVHHVDMPTAGLLSLALADFVCE